MFKRGDRFLLPDIEQRVLDFWRTNHIFKKTQEARRKKNKFVFYEGPPTANGRPGIHHVLARSFKDIILRYKTMRGFFVTRRGGWDTHGLPVELGVEKALGINSKKEIEAYGVEKFNQKCKESVWKYKDEWEKLTERIGFWVDLEYPYITYENSFMESVWWILKRVWENNMLYRGYKVLPWCPRCGTALSSHELAQGYSTVRDTSVYVKFKVKPRQKIGKRTSGNNTYILSWTTTPWTLPGNVALAVGENITYVEIEKDGERLLYAKNSPLAKSFGHVGREISGKDLLGLRYEPLFTIKEFQNNRKAYRVYHADFVATNEGTGVVHTAVMYGEDDYQLGVDVGLPQHHTVDESGRFTKDVPGFRGLFVKDKETEKKIIAVLKKQNNLLHTEQYEHEYPFCWRCDTPILYYARHSWFIKMSALRKKLLAANEQVRWVPDHTKHGRFGEWLREVKDWALSRERYWATPLPVWTCSDCDAVEVMGSYRELNSRLGGARNTYVLMRHGLAESNTKNIVNSNPKDKNKFGLTLTGRVQVEQAVKLLKKRKNKIDVIISSDFRRTKETAEIIGKSLNITATTSVHLREVNTGTFHGGDPGAYGAYFAKPADKFSKRPPEGEHLRDIAKRVYRAVTDIEKKYKNKTVLIISHDYPLWMLETVMRNWGEEQSLLVKQKQEQSGACDFFGTGEVREVECMQAPRNKWGFADFHRPYVDKLTFPCSTCGKKMKRVPEVIDGWFDSGAMPFAQAHYPFSCVKKEGAQTPSPESCIDFPGDFIAEGVDQTRGWFYSLLAIGVLLKQESPYRNVISHGLVLDSYGRKMSKSRGNMVSPWEIADKFGIDVVRWYFYTVNAPGEPKRFDEKELRKTSANFIMLLYNSFVFFRTYRAKHVSLQKREVRHVLDTWILARLAEVTRESTRRLDVYDVVGAARLIEELVQDLSRWYIRRSRRRFQRPESARAHASASYTLGHVLLGVSKLIAPFTPFLSEALYHSLTSETTDYEFKESVHLEDWTKQEQGLSNAGLLKAMKEVRELARAGLAKRELVSMKVRQPLASLSIKRAPMVRKDKELQKILREEVNVKRVLFNTNQKEDVVLDSVLTHELEEEGWVRELVRTIQRMRQDAGLEPGDTIALGIDAPKLFDATMRRYSKTIQEEISASEIRYTPLRTHTLNRQTRIGPYEIKLTLKKR